ncbi:BTB/POZ domain-containing protein 9 [Paramecium bursaria]
MQLTDSEKVCSNYQDFNCQAHPECLLQIFYLGENKDKQSRIMCVKCIINNTNREEKLSPYIYLNDVFTNFIQFINNPVNTLLNILKINKRQGVKLSQSQILDEMDKQLKEFEEKIKNQMIQIRQNVLQMRTILEEFSQEFSNQLELNDIVKQIELLRSVDSTQRTKEVQKLEDHLKNLSDNLEKINIRQNLLAKNMNNSLQIIKNESVNLISKQKEQLNKVLIPLNDDIKGFPDIHYKISEGKSIQFQLIYQGSKDGLNAKSYWNKCNLQSNLLTIMTSENGNKFGSYSPCQINHQLNNYVADASLKTFLFQCNKKEIYQLKDSQNAMYCSLQYGPNYGKKNDIQILPDFIGGCSNIGDCYDASNCNIADNKTHIFGAATPQLQECKVYKVVFD